MLTLMNEADEQSFLSSQASTFVFKLSFSHPTALISRSAGRYEARSLTHTGHGEMP